MIISITGATGFIAKALTLKHLQRGDEVRVFSRRKREILDVPEAVQVFNGDLTVGGESLNQFVENADILYHCAGEIRNNDLMRKLHINGTQNLLDAADRTIAHWVQLSSVGVYGPRRTGIVTEKTPLNPIGEYEQTKTKSDKLVIENAQNNGFSFSILRPSIVFGPQMPNRSVFQLISMIKRGLFFFIGPEGATANYIHVDNVVEALFQCGVNPAAKNRIYNISDAATMEEFVAMISDCLGKPSPKLRLPQIPIDLLARIAGCIPGSPLTRSRVDALTGRSVYSSDRISKELNYSHRVSIGEGIRQMVDSIQTP